MGGDSPAVDLLAKLFFCHAEGFLQVVKQRGLAAFDVAQVVVCEIGVFRLQSLADRIPISPKIKCRHSGTSIVHSGLHGRNPVRVPAGRKIPRAIPDRVPESVV